MDSKQEEKGMAQSKILNTTEGAGVTELFSGDKEAEAQNDVDTSDELDDLHATILSMCSDKPAKCPDVTAELNPCHLKELSNEAAVSQCEEETEEEKIANDILAEDFSFSSKSFSLSPIKKTTKNIGKDDEFDYEQFSLFSPAMTYSSSYKTPLLKKYPSRYIRVQSTPVNVRAQSTPISAQSTPISALGKAGHLSEESRKRKIETQTFPVADDADSDIKELSFEELLSEVTTLCGGKFEFNKELPEQPKTGDKELTLNMNAENVSRINLDSIISQTFKPKDEGSGPAEAETVAVNEDKGPGRFSGLQTSTRHTINYSVEEEDHLDISEDILGLDDYEGSEEEIDEKTLLSDGEETVLLDKTLTSAMSKDKTLTSAMSKDKTLTSAMSKEERKGDAVGGEEMFKFDKDLEVSENYDSEAGIEQGSDDEVNEDDEYIVIDSILPSSDLDADTSGEIKVSATTKTRTVPQNMSEDYASAFTTDGKATALKDSSENTSSASAVNKTTTVPTDMSLDTFVTGRDEFEFDITREICDVSNFLEKEGFATSDTDEEKTNMALRMKTVGDIEKEGEDFDLSSKGKSDENKTNDLPTGTIDIDSTSVSAVTEGQSNEPDIKEKKQELAVSKSQPFQTSSVTHRPPTVTVAPIQLDKINKNDNVLDMRNNNTGAGMKREQTHFDYKAERDFLKNESPLMNEVMRKWDVRGIQNPDTNLTCATRYRKKHCGARRGRLEGFQMCTLEQRSRSDGCRSPSTKRSRSSNYVNDINNLKTQLSEITRAARNKADAMRREEEQEREKVRNLHGRRIRNLNLQQEMEVRNLHSNRMLNKYMQQTRLMQLRIEHMNQSAHLKSVFHAEMERVNEHYRTKFAEESDNFKHRREQISCLIEQLTSKGEDFGARDEHFGPHVTTSLVKAPCRANNNTKSFVTVCLPANIATSILREDEVYNSFYNYE